MSSFKPVSRRFALLSLALALPALAACSFTPVYSGANTDELALRYAEPKDKYEQVVYQRLATSVGNSSSEFAPLVTISTSMGGRGIGRTSSNSVTSDYEMVATGTLTVTDSDNDKTVLMTQKRTAAAIYEQNGQVLSDRAAIDDAKLRAAKALAEAFRLSLISNKTLTQGR